MAITVFWYTLIFLGYLIFAVAIILLALIFIPYEYQISGENLDRPQVEGNVSWFFGGLKCSFHHDFQSKATVTPIIFGIRLQNTVKNSSQGAKIKKGRQISSGAKQKERNLIKKKPPDFRQFLKIEILRNALQVIAKTIQHLRPRTLAIDAQVGLFDPMMTGLFSAVNSQFYDYMHQYNINLQPVFDEETIKGRFRIGGRIRLAYLISVFFAFLITKSIRRMILAQLKIKLMGGLHYV